MSKLVWRVKLVVERQPGMTTETELTCIERDAQAGLADGSVKNLGHYAARWNAGWPKRPSSTAALT